jgi:hypothetical protein
LPDFLHGRLPFGLNLISGQKVQKSRARPSVYVNGAAQIGLA